MSQLIGPLKNSHYHHHHNASADDGDRARRGEWVVASPIPKLGTYFIENDVCMRQFNCNRLHFDIEEGQPLTAPPHSCSTWQGGADPSLSRLIRFKEKETDRKV